MPAPSTTFAVSMQIASRVALLSFLKPRMSILVLARMAPFASRTPMFALLAPMSMPILAAIPL
jgi:hypothetical protein